MFAATLGFSLLAQIAPVFAQTNFTAPTNQRDIFNGSYTFVDRATIKATIGGKEYTFIDIDIGDMTIKYEIQGSDCPGWIEFGNNDPVAGTSTLNVDFRDGGGCKNTDPDNYKAANINRAGANTWFLWADSANLVRADKRPEYNFTLDSSDTTGTRFMRASELNGSCIDIILVDGAKRNFSYYQLNGTNSFPSVNDLPQNLRDRVKQNECFIYSTIPRNNNEPREYKPGQNYALGDTAKASDPGGSGGTGGINGGTNQADVETCENNSTWSINWLACAIIEGIDGALNALTNEVQLLLTVDSSLYETNEIKIAWANINRIASVSLLVAGLVMVIATAAGFDIIDAYTIRKILPKLVLAAIGMQISWYVISFVIGLTNDIGRGIADIMYAPFGGESHVDLASNLRNAGGAGAQGIFTAAVIVGGFAAFLPGYLALAATALLSLLLGFAILLLRRVAIIMLLILSPIAIMSSVLPNTDGLWKFWKGAFSKLLLMYPMIMILVAAGKIFGYVSAGTNATKDTDMNQVLSSIFKFGAVVFGEFFIWIVVPFAAKFLGGAAANLAGIFNDRSRGAFDALRNKRRSNTESRLARAQRGEVFNTSKIPENRSALLSKLRGKDVRRPSLRRMVNSAYMLGTNNPTETGGYYMGKAARGAGITSSMPVLGKMATAGKALQSKIDMGNLAKTENLVKSLNGIDRGLTALTGDNKYLQERGMGPIHTMQDLDKAIALLQQSDVEQDKLAAQELTLQYGTIADTWKDKDLGGGSIAGAALIAAAGQGMVGADEIARTANAIGNTRGAGLGTAIARSANLAGMRGGRPELKPGHALRVKYKDGQAVYYNAMSFKDENGKDRDQEGMLEAIEAQASYIQGASTGDLMGAKVKTVEQTAAGMQEIIRRGYLADNARMENGQLMVRNSETNAYEAASERDKWSYNKMTRDKDGNEIPDGIDKARRIAGGMKRIVANQRSPLSNKDATSQAEYDRIFQSVRYAYTDEDARNMRGISDIDAASAQSLLQSQQPPDPFAGMGTQDS